MLHSCVCASVFVCDFRKLNERCVVHESRAVDCIAYVQCYSEIATDIIQTASKIACIHADADCHTTTIFGGRSIYT